MANDESRYKRLLAHYHELMLEMDRLYIISLAKPDVISLAHMRQLLHKELTMLFQRLRTHFHDEEQGGYMSEVIAEKPNWAKQVELLKGQHSQLLHAIEQLSAEVQTASDMEAVEAVKAKIGHVLKQIRDHKRSEEEIMETAFFEDLGCCD